MLGAVGHAELMGREVLAGLGFVALQCLRLWQQGRLKEGLKLLLPGLLCVHIGQLDLSGQLGLPWKDT